MTTCLRTQSLVLVTLIALVPALAGYAGNLLVNPGFETGDLSGWEYFGPGWRLGGGGDAHTGAKGLVDDVLTTDPSYANWRVCYQLVEARAGQTFYASAYVRGVIIESSEAWLEVQFLDANYQVLQQHQSAHITQDQAFQQVEIQSMTAPNNTAWISVRAVVHMITPPTSSPDFMIFDDFVLAGQLSAADQQYLQTLASDTWNWISANVASGTGLPYDNKYHGEYTSASDIGLYLTAVVAARDLGLINNNAASSKLSQAIDSIKQLDTWHGFQQCWNSVTTLEPSPWDTWVSILDSAHLAAGLIVVGEAFPQFKSDCNALVNAMDWAFFYDSQVKKLHGGYNTATDEINPDWWLFWVGADSRMANFLAIATEDVPAESWDALNREKEAWYDIQYFEPGWDGGGLFMQYISGLWLDELGTDMGDSAAEFARAQVTHREIAGYPVWGWSACDSPTNGYLGWGMLLDRIVTPHASALALADVPVRVVENLRDLEALGVRHASNGFYDSYDFQSQEITDNFLMLDQSMLFLSLANYLGTPNARTRFGGSSIAANGYNLIADYQ